nr:TetR/AcrR family transcriptional regulator [Mesorhizobium sp.]
MTATKTKKIPTRERIVQTAITLFNEDGVNAVAAYRIAADLAISPGNLTYYFSTKTEIVREIVTRLESQLVTAIHSFDDPSDADQISALLVRIFRIMRSYRFVFEGIQSIAGLDPEIERKYRELEAHIQLTTTKVIEKVIGDGLMKPIRAPNSTALVVDNLWAAWLYCIRSPKLAGLRGNDADDAAVYLCALHHFSMLEPYFSNRFATSMYENIEALRPKGAIKG